MTSNILFIVIDSLRANYCYDHKKSYSTPNLDQIIKKVHILLNLLLVLMEQDLY